MKPDAKGRVCLGKFLECGANSYKVEIKKDGEILLKPYVEISLKELQSLKEKTMVNDQVLNDLLKGLKGPLADMLKEQK